MREGLSQRMQRNSAGVGASSPLAWSVAAISLQSLSIAVMRSHRIMQSCAHMCIEMVGCYLELCYEGAAVGGVGVAGRATNMGLMRG